MLQYDSCSVRWIFYPANYKSINKTESNIDHNTSRLIYPEIPPRLWKVMITARKIKVDIIIFSVNLVKENNDITCRRSCSEETAFLQKMSRVIKIRGKQPPL